MQGTTTKLEDVNDMQQKERIEELESLLKEVLPMLGEKMPNAWREGLKQRIECALAK